MLSIIACALVLSCIYFVVMNSPFVFNLSLFFFQVLLFALLFKCSCKSIFLFLPLLSSSSFFKASCKAAAIFFLGLLLSIIKVYYIRKIFIIIAIYQLVTEITFLFSSFFLHFFFFFFILSSSLALPSVSMLFCLLILLYLVLFLIGSYSLVHFCFLVIFFHNFLLQ